VSHNQATLTELCDRVILIEDGMTKMEGSPQDVFAVYQQKKADV
jgi:ABC-type polysaccharide/polyol phosphate transport system ATPase subunit